MILNWLIAFRDQNMPTSKLFVTSRVFPHCTRKASRMPGQITVPAICFPVLVKL